MRLIFGKKELFARAPRLDTILMVEEFLEKNSGKYTLSEIFKLLPKKMLWNTFKVIFLYLEKSNKIVVNKDGKITWIWNPSLSRKYSSLKELEIKLL